MLTLKELILLKKQFKPMTNKEFQNTVAYQKHILPFLKAEKARKKTKRILWLKDNAFNIINLFFTVMTLLATVILGILQLHS